MTRLLLVPLALVTVLGAGPASAYEGVVGTIVKVGADCSDPAHCYCVKQTILGHEYGVCGDNPGNVTR